MNKKIIDKSVDKFASITEKSRWALAKAKFKDQNGIEVIVVTLNPLSTISERLILSNKKPFNLYKKTCCSHFYKTCTRYKNQVYTKFLGGDIAVAQTNKLNLSYAPTRLIKAKRVCQLKGLSIILNSIVRVTIVTILAIIAITDDVVNFVNSDIVAVFTKFEVNDDKGSFPTGAFPTGAFPTGAFPTGAAGNIKTCKKFLDTQYLYDETVSDALIRIVLVTFYDNQVNHCRNRKGVSRLKGPSIVIIAITIKDDAVNFVNSDIVGFFTKFELIGRFDSINTPMCKIVVSICSYLVSPSLISRIANLVNSDIVALSIMSDIVAVTLKTGDVVIPTCLKGFPSISMLNMEDKVLDFNNGENTNVRRSLRSTIDDEVLIIKASLSKDKRNRHFMIYEIFGCGSLYSVCPAILNVEFEDTICRYTSKISLYFKNIIQGWSLLSDKPIVWPVTLLVLTMNQMVSGPGKK
jgi:hypothetical protein